MSNELKDIEVFEISFVERAANKKKFLLIKANAKIGDELKQRIDNLSTRLTLQASVKKLNDVAVKVLDNIERIGGLDERTAEVSASQK